MNATDQDNPALSKAAQTIYAYIGSQTSVEDVRKKAWKDYGAAEVNAALTELHKKRLIDTDSTKEWVRRKDTSGSTVPKPRTSPETSTVDPNSNEPAEFKGKGEVPKPKISYRDPRTQNEHMFAIMNAKGLTTNERWVGTVMHYQCFGQEKRDNPLSPSRELAKEYLAAQCQINRVQTVQSAATALVERGFFVRTDNGKGGRVKRATQGRGYGATYRPVVPDLNQ